MMLLSFLLGASQAADSGFVFRPVVADTTLLQNEPAQNFGREAYLLGGSGRTALVKFPDVGFREGRGAFVSSAKLVLKLVRADSVGQVEVRRVNRPWMEGRGRLLPFAPQAKDVPLPWGSASWTTAFKGAKEERWASGGGVGDQDSRGIDGVTATQDRDVLTIDGLGATVQGWIERPEDNYGLLLRFSRDVAIFSGDSGADGPQLDLQWETADVAGGADLAVVSLEPEGAVREGQPTKWTATVANVGPSAAGVVTGEWTSAEGAVTRMEPISGLAAGATATVSLEVNQGVVYGDPRRSTLRLRVATENETDRSQNSLEVYPMGLAVAGPGGSVRELVAQRQVVDFLNTVVLPFSRSSFAPEGVTERLRFVTDAAKADLSFGSGEGFSGPSSWPWKGVAYGSAKALVRALTPLSKEVVEGGLKNEGRSETVGLGWLADTRDDGLVIPILTLPDLEWAEPKPNEPTTPLTGFLSRVEAGFLQANIGRRGAERGWEAITITPSVLLQVKDVLGRPLNSGSVQVLQEGAAEPVAKGSIARGGFVALQIPRDAISADRPYLVIEVNRGGESERANLSYWDLVDSAVRGNKAASGVEVTMMTTDVRVDYATSLAEGKIVTDAKGRFPAELGALVDGAFGAGVEVLPTNWVEIDIGRDRTFGAVEIVFEGAPFGAFEIYTFKTGQSPTDAVAFFADRDGAKTARFFGTESPEGLRVVYKSSSVQSRYVRLVNTGPTPASVKEIRILPAL